ncbi:DUF1285 domain-containing protein [Amphiplicatus metriothermophilus]|uniref:DUF1285 domain-containing protein n=1 Tax=Amphiplicatus metriothermophilus TaxID=1519374 RepID=A0A239PS88_9PROT|nr:DUF1285 domain-containing protein [Amphiplicatus metriothermophilus]MBB5519094.1 hypothetical protein [Amphiplicatus metriothermophilus]SNT73164.1 hypothetical protein SAMN06297382_1561 [Amphiplicatus metriothermophilus]
MSDFMSYAAALEGRACAGDLPPVERWDPPYCGELDLVIRRDGTWVHEGTPIGRARLVRLFSTILKREGGRYFLVTPVEKLAIAVEDAPFLAVLMRAEGEGNARRLVFTTNVGEEIAAGPGHEIVFRPSPATGEIAPYLRVRDDLWALVARAVYYDLVALSETRDTPDGPVMGVASGGAFFPFEPAGADVDASNERA